MDNPFAVIERRMNRNEILLEQVLKILTMKDQSEEKLISSVQACKVFSPQISRPTLQSWTDSGSLKSYRIGGRVYYKHSEIIAAVKEIKKYKKTVEESSVSEQSR